MNLFIFYAEVQPVFATDKYKHFVLTAKINMTFFWIRTFFLKYCSISIQKKNEYSFKKKGSNYE